MPTKGSAKNIPTTPEEQTCSTPEIHKSRKVFRFLVARHTL